MKKQYILTTAALVIAIGTGAYLAFNPHNTNPAMSTVAQAQASAGKSRPICRANNAAHLNLTAHDARDIDITGTTYITDVPAGTNADVRIASYDGKTMTGATIYPGSYGSYNFEAEKINVSGDNQISWKVTHFAACQQ